MDLLIHGIYDAQTLKTITQMNVPRIGFDLRGRSLNLVPFHVLKSFVPLIKQQKLYLIFENDKLSTINSFLDLLGKDKDRFELEFRDNLGPEFYASLNRPFGWFFNSEGDWDKMLALPKLQTLFLPTKYKDLYQNNPKLWHMIQEKNLQVILHCEHFEDLELYVSNKNLTLSVDLGKDVESGFREIDQNRLLNLKIWRKSYAPLAGQ